MTMRRTTWAAVAMAASLAAGGARAQTTCPTTANTSPGFSTGGSVFGFLATQWNLFFNGKADANNGVLCSPTINNPTFTGSALILQQFTAAAGLASQTGTRNPGNQIVTNGANLSLQLVPIAKSFSYAVNSDLGGRSDSGAVLYPTTSGITFTLPNPSTGTIGTAYHFSSNGTYGYALTTAGGTASIFGCATAATSQLLMPGDAVDAYDTGTAYLCASRGALTWLTAYDAPLTGDTYTTARRIGSVILNPAGTIATLTVVAPPGAVDGEPFSVSTTQDVTALTVSPSAGQSLVGGGAALLSQNAGAGWLYRAADATWYRR